MHTNIDNNRLKTGLASAALLGLGTVMSVMALPAVADDPSTCVPSPAIAATTGTPAIPATTGTPAVAAVPAIPAVPATEDTFIDLQFFVFTGNFKPGDVLPDRNDPLFMAVPAQPQGPKFVDRAIGVVFNVSNDDNNTPGLGSIFKFDGTLAPGTPGTAEVPGTPAVPAVLGAPAVPAVPGTPAVPAVTCDSDGGSEPPLPTPIVEDDEVLGEEASNNNGNNNNGGNNNGGGSPEVLGAQASANNAPAPAVQQSAPASAAAQVPTLINAGTAGEAPANPLAPAAIALFGALMGLIALGMRGGLARVGGGKA